MTRFLTIAAALAMAGAAAPVAAQSYDAKRVVMSVKQADLEAIVKSLGHTIKETGKPGETYLAAESEDGIIYLLFGTACDVKGVPGCQGVMMQARYDLPATTTYQTLAKANDDLAAIGTTADFTEKSLIFTRYHVLDKGVTMGNISANVDVLLGLVGDAYAMAAGEEPAAE
ncbi:hypothetical protein [Erythrobacter oryzae]|uniref:hypothetical protein n=1 Tax=Erythrobacter oryzae TaxID=3019556 RepID=UPI0025561BE4|nr:hypothetical protein [Erythrobacter sp. COR-2]